MRVKSKPEAQNDPDVQEAVAKVAEMLGDTGRILVRESGTEPVIRVMVEAETESLCEKICGSGDRCDQIQGAYSLKRIPDVKCTEEKCEI